MPIHDAELASDQDSDLDYMPFEYEDFAFNAISLTNPARDDSALAETLTGDNEYSESADEDQHTHSVALEIPVHEAGDIAPTPTVDIHRNTTN